MQNHCQERSWNLSETRWVLTVDRFVDSQFTESKQRMLNYKEAFDAYMITVTYTFPLRVWMITYIFPLRVWMIS